MAHVIPNAATHRRLPLRVKSRLPRCKIGRPSPQRRMKAGPFTTASRRLFKLVQSSPPFKRPAEMKAHVG
jgi:hypothetical protein